MKGAEERFRNSKMFVYEVKSSEGFDIQEFPLTFISCSRRRPVSHCLRDLQEP